MPSTISVPFLTLNHPLRIPLSAEIHSRPSLKIQSPASITHFAIYAKSGSLGSDDNLVAQHHLLSSFCSVYGVASPHVEAKYFLYDFGRFRLQWECHTEFATYSFVESDEASSSGANTQDGDVASLFQNMPLRHLPKQWLDELKEKIIVAAHIALVKSNTLSGHVKTWQPAFEGLALVGSKVLDRGEVWSDFLIQSDGFTRYIVNDENFIQQQAGRTVQRLLEIETYRMMALLGLPDAQSANPALIEIESELVKLTSALALVGTSQPANSERHQLINDNDVEQQLLRQIIDLAVGLEKLTVGNSYRFSASKAYFDIVKARINELREFRIEGMPTIGEFMERRLAPAMNTCEAIVRRQEALARRIAHTNDLLRTRVGIVQELQNRQILQSMDARAGQQLKLQQSVEGLSVVAISYYLVGLLQYAGKGLKASGVAVNVELISGLLIPVVAAGVWLGLRRLHKTIVN